MFLQNCEESKHLFLSSYLNNSNHINKLFKQATAINLCSQNIQRVSEALSEYYRCIRTMDLCVTHTWAFLLAPTHEPTLSYHLFTVTGEDRPAVSPSGLHNTPQYHVCSHTNNLHRQTNTLVHCFPWSFRLKNFFAYVHIYHMKLKEQQLQ